MGELLKGPIEKLNELSTKLVDMVMNQFNALAPVLQALTLIVLAVFVVIAVFTILKNSIKVAITLAAIAVVLYVGWTFFLK